MTKKRSAKTPPKAAALNQIGSLILTLSQTYPRQAARYRKAAADARRWSEYPVGHTCYPLASKWHERAMREAATWRDQCNQRQDELATLARLVAVHFPEFDGKLRAVRFHAIAWHDKPADEWGPLLDELGLVEAAAVRAAEQLTPTAKPKRGRRAMTREELEAKLEEADLLGAAVYRKKHGIDESTISKWRARLAKMK